MTSIAEKVSVAVLSNPIFSLLILWPPKFLSRRRKSSKITLHVGQHKTASTSTQAFLFSNRYALARNGVFVPRVGVFGWHHGLATHTPTRTATLPGGLSKTLRRIAKRYANDGRHVVISAESLSHFPRMRVSYDELATAFSEFDEVSVVMVVRSQTHLLQSIFAEMLKVGTAIHPSEVVQRALEHSGFLGVYLDYSRLYEDLLGSFPKQSIKVLNFERITLPDDILRSLGTPDHLITRSPGIHQNASKSALEEWAASNGYGDPDALSSGKLSIFTEKECDSLIAHFAPLNEAFKELVADPKLGSFKMKFGEDVEFRQDASEDIAI